MRKRKNVYIQAKIQMASRGHHTFLPQQIRKKELHFGTVSVLAAKVPGER